MPIKALEGLAPEWYTPKGQDKDSAPTRFRVKPLNGYEYGEVSDYLTIDGGRFFIRNEGRDRCLKYGVVDWENFSNSTGKVDFDPENLAMIPHVVRVELVTRIMEISSLSEDQKKTS